MLLYMIRVLYKCNLHDRGYNTSAQNGWLESVGHFSSVQQIFPVPYQVPGTGHTE